MQIVTVTTKPALMYEKNFSKAPNRIFTLDASVFRNSCSQMFYKIGVLKILQIFTEKHLCRNIIFDKVAVFQAGPPCDCFCLLNK